ncbi:MAG: NB-ARC domain-containing protein [Cyanobacteria bacterium J06607_10]
MPRLSTSPKVKARIRILLKKILEEVDMGMAGPHYSSDVFDYRWVDEDTPYPKLVVKTKLPFLAELIASESATPISKDHIREVLLVLQKKLGILEDNRVKTQGSDVWDFTLKLWHTSPARNLTRFEQAWTRYKNGHYPLDGYKPDKVKQAPQQLSETLSPLAPLAIPTATPKRLLHNLTLRPSSHFIDSQQGLRELMEALSNASTDAIVSIVGPGGIGKTALALEAAHRCLAVAEHPEQSSQLPVFDVITFVSAQPKEFLGPYLSERWQTERTLKDIIREILKTVDCAEGLPFELTQQIDYIHSTLKEVPTLLILDNLETVEEPKRLLSFIRTLPPTVKVVLTSRTRFGVGRTIELTYLTTETSYALIRHQAKKKLVELEASQVHEIYQLSGGLPLAMAYSVGYLSVHRHLPALKRSHHNQPPSEIANYCVAASLEQLKEPSAHHLLMAATLFTEKFSIKAAAHVANLPQPSEDIFPELSSLYRLSLVNKLDKLYYSMHAFTQDFAAEKLENDFAFKKAAQERWLDWYTNLVQPLAETWLDWQDYRDMELEWSNIRALFNWCMETKRYSAAQKLWLGLRGYTLVRGYWDERQVWMDGFITMAEQRDDQVGLAQAMFYKAQTLVHIDDTDAQGEALELLKSFWKLKAPVDSDIAFAALAYVATIYRQRNDLIESRQWLNKKEELGQLSAVSEKRYQSVINYHIAEIEMERHNYKDAEQAYRDGLSLAEELNWQKQAIYIKGGLATLLIEKSELDEAENLITFVLEMAKNYQDKRVIAKCYLNLAMIAEKRSCSDEFSIWTKLAQNEFKKLGMIPLANQMQQWLREQKET